jgi:hypothetical protein
MGGCAKDDTQKTFVNKATIDSQAGYVGQSKASVEAALGAPDAVEVYDPATTTACMMMTRFGQLPQPALSQ